MIRTISLIWFVCFGVLPIAALPQDTDAARNASDIALRAKEVFRTHCLQCHGGKTTQAGIAILDHQLLLDKDTIIPGEPDDSLLFQLVTSDNDSGMPPPGRPRLSRRTKGDS